LKQAKCRSFLGDVGFAALARTRPVPHAASRIAKTVAEFDDDDDADVDDDNWEDSLFGDELGDSGIATTPSAQQGVDTASSAITTARGGSDGQVGDFSAVDAAAGKEWDEEIAEFRKTPIGFDRDIKRLGAEEFLRSFREVTKDEYASEYTKSGRMEKGKLIDPVSPFNAAQVEDEALDDMPWAAWDEDQYWGDKEDPDFKAAMRRAKVVDKHMMKSLKERDNRRDELASWRDDWYQKTRLPVPMESNYEKFLYGEDVPTYDASAPPAPLSELLLGSYPPQR
jgi:hypothetical protein